MEKQTQKLQDEGKLAYMIAWRDRKIATLQDMLTVAEQKDGIYAAYIVWLLERLGKEQGEIRVPKAQIRALCGIYTVDAQDGGEDFVITLKRKDEGDGTARGKMADA